MAVISQRSNTRVAAADNQGKSLFSFSKVNPLATADEVAMFVAGINGFRQTASDTAYFITEDQLLADETGE